MQRMMRTAALAATVALVAACSDSATEPEEAEPEIDRMALTIGAQTYTVPANGTFTQTITIARATPVVVSAVFQRANGTPDPVAMDPAIFELRVTGGAGVTFTRTGAFAGTLTGATAGAQSVTFIAFHKGEQHEDFEKAITITVQ
jgi:hypothetical protein